MRFKYILLEEKKIREEKTFFHFRGNYTIRSVLGRRHSCEMLLGQRTEELKFRKTSLLQTLSSMALATHITPIRYQIASTFQSHIHFAYNIIETWCVNEYHIQSHISVHGTVSIIEKSDANAINCRPCAHVSDGNSLISMIENHLCSA